MRLGSKSLAAFLGLSMIASACSSDDDAAENEWGQPTLGTTDFDDSEGKADGTSGRRGLPTSTDSASTAVWEVSNRWRDTDTPAAQKAGMAWSENSGLDWDQKYRAWVDSLERVECDDCFGETFAITTPYGKTLPAPSLECAEQAMFMRIAFASWYNLPFFMEATSGGERIFFGHFGIRTASGRWNNTPNFKTRYPDFSDQALSVADGGAWPSDASLRGKKIVGSFDDQQPMIGPDAHAGDYFDEMFLNKRVGHFLRFQLIFLGSVNLGDTANLYNLKATAIAPGDVLVKRSNQNGIGHTYLIKRRIEHGEILVDGELMPALEVEAGSGSMPRRQPQWDSSTSIKFALTNSSTGGPGKGKFGGGIKRWRTAAAIGGRWTNVILPSNQETFISTSDMEQIEARPGVFDEIIGELTPDRQLEALLQVVERERAHLREHPSSCSARTRREAAFNSIYDLADELETTPEALDREHRNLEDYVFAELEYEESKTCCWNSTNRDMYDIAMELAEAEIAAQEPETCTAVSVFKARDDDGDGYDMYREFAAETEREGTWVAWSADESCPQSGVAVDTELELNSVDFCEWSAPGDEPTPEPEPMPEPEPVPEPMPMF